MSTALRIAHGAFGRVALLDMDWSLVRHAHPHCHVLLKVEGADTQFMVGDRIYPLTAQTAVLVNGWQPHSYVHDPARPRTVILALYIEPEWLMAFRPGWAASGAPGFFEPSFRRCFFAHPRPGHELGGRHDGPARRAGRPRIRIVGPNDRGDRAFYAMAKFSGLDQRDECPLWRLAHPPRHGIDASWRSGVPRSTHSRRKRDCRGRISFACSNPRSGVPPKVYPERGPHGARGRCSAKSVGNFAKSATSSASPSPRISLASSATMPA